MEYLKELERLGSLEPLYEENTNEIFNANELLVIKKRFTNRLPSDYRDFILKNPVCSFDNYVVFDSINKEAEYIHPAQYGYPKPTFNASTIAVFFSKEKDVYDLFWNIQSYKERIPDNMLPIFCDGMGNLGLLSLQKDTYEKVYFWDHEWEWDIDDYLERQGQICPKQLNSRTYGA